MVSRRQRRAKYRHSPILMGIESIFPKCKEPWYQPNYGGVSK